MKDFISRILNAGIRSWIAILCILCSFSIMSVLVFHAIPETNKDAVNLALGFVLGSSISGIIGYYFVDSKKNSNNE